MVSTRRFESGYEAKKEPQPSSPVLRTRPRRELHSCAPDTAGVVSTPKLVPLSTSEQAVKMKSREGDAQPCQESPSSVFTVNRQQEASLVSPAVCVSPDLTQSVSTAPLNSHPAPSGSGKVVLSPPLLFDEKGRAFVSWLLAFKRYCGAHELSEKLSCSLAIMCLKDVSCDWYKWIVEKGMNQGQGKIQSWLELKYYLKAEFLSSLVCKLLLNEHTVSGLRINYSFEKLCGLTLRVEGVCDMSKVKPEISIKYAQKRVPELSNGSLSILCVHEGHPLSYYVLGCKRIMQQVGHINDVDYGAVGPQRRHEYAVECGEIAAVIYVDKRYVCPPIVGLFVCAKELKTWEEFRPELLQEEELNSILDPDVSVPEIVWKSELKSVLNSENSEYYFKNLMRYVLLSESAHDVLIMQQECATTLGETQSGLIRSSKLKSDSQSDLKTDMETAVHMPESLLSELDCAAACMAKWSDFVVLKVEKPSWHDCAASYAFAGPNSVCKQRSESVLKSDLSELNATLTGLVLCAVGVGTVELRLLCSCASFCSAKTGPSEELSPGLKSEVSRTRYAASILKLCAKNGPDVADVLLLYQCDLTVVFLVEKHGNYELIWQQETTANCEIF